MNLKKIFSNVWQFLSSDGFTDVLKDPFVISMYSILILSFIFRGCI